MLIKMKESKGFTLVELMIVVAIIGILAAVAVPYYQRYVAKSRLTSLVMPAVHSIETNISTFYAVQSTLPDIGTSGTVALTQFEGDADMTFISVTSASWSATDHKLKVTVLTDSVDPATGKKPFASITAAQNYFNLVANPQAGGKLYWTYSGPLATELGL